MNNKSLIVFNSDIKDINYKMPERAKDLDKTTVKKIINAINRGKPDSRGLIWIKCSTLHTVLRVKTKVDARYLLETIDKKYKTTYEGEEYVLWSSIISIVERRREENPKNRYLSLVMDILNEINECDEIQLLRLKAKNLMEQRVKKLKNKRIRSYKLKDDELTNDPLDKKKAEFSHIRSVAMFPELAEMLWNGLIVNKDTHFIITQVGINDEEELYKLCYEKGWNTAWYKTYKEKLNN
ncbi:hypothetical protein POG14_06250 [Clostridium paraputrificum]|uniref:hypothetical protein n=1 Tax=Clostridium paraputrificum TaxID=29363 RepID=UPI001898204E|nr:hypothetical protein [Clostridium paraputrificum]MDC0801781.1 hypothetical protein [Clostridium paraputrificum]